MGRVGRNIETTQKMKGEILPIYCTLRRNEKKIENRKAGIAERG